mmetsp:Transcript_26078/g.41355  ORF Transcript_26078/g.41355 Transcript_26078/m.41355 type:complete len:89 (+) Transcript_26078:91-357(+)
MRKGQVPAYVLLPHRQGTRSCSGSVDPGPGGGGGGGGDRQKRAMMDGQGLRFPRTTPDAHGNVIGVCSLGSDFPFLSLCPSASASVRS